jgi:hypothetical protein
VPLQSAYSIETAPIGYLASRIQADPSFAFELPDIQDAAEPARWERRMRFALEAAVCGELDTRGIVEAVPQIPEDEPVISLRHLGLALDELWRPVGREKLAGMYEDEAWEPVFMRTQVLLDASPYEYVHSLEHYTAVLEESSPSLVARFVGALYLAASSKRTQFQPRPDTLTVVRNSVELVRRVGARGFDAAVSMMGDFEMNDRNQLLELQEAEARLRFTQPLISCPVSIKSQTVAEVEEAARQQDEEPLGCPATKYGRIVEKLAHRIIDDAERLAVLD